MTLRYGQPKGQPRGGRDRDRSPIPARIPRRVVHYLALLEPIVRRGPGLLWAVEFGHRAEERS
jgi:hypothetical protein